MFKGKLIKFLLQRSFIVGILIFLQVVFLAFVIIKMANQFVYIYVFLMLFSIAVVLYITSDSINPAYKLAWTSLILLFPLFGGVFYFLFGTSRINSYLKNKITFQKENTKKKNNKKPEIKNDGFSPLVTSQMTYLSDFYPVCKGDSAYYYKSGEEYFEAISEEIKKAEKYIFLEYFIISEGVMWDNILRILKEKAAFGVDVRIIYDDCGCLSLLPRRYSEMMEKYNIKCRVFNPFKPSLSITMNNRDHRKILIVDGKTAFTGGINVSDEYINEIKLHGHWKDNGVKVQGECVNTFVDIFIEMWNIIKYDEKDASKYYYNHKKPVVKDGYIQVYADNPYDDETVGENVYLNIINKAVKELYITTPYLILDNELLTALMLAAKSGVDVNIITPGNGDKWYVHMTTRANYYCLIKAGVHIYEYKDGFIHSKTFLCDDEIATVGSINLDYRSLYLHFECGVCFYNHKIIKCIKKDILDTISKCKEITLPDCRKNVFIRILRSILRLFAPLM